MNELKICGLVLCALIICIVFKNLKSEYTLLIRIAITVGISILSLALVTPLLSFIDEISKNTVVYSYLPTLVKALCIALIVQITADICRDAGESALGERVELFGKAEILVISIPLIKNLFKLCEGIIK
ncbi:MAG: stage III sporulation AC/AD family protein [Clostridia bacterium]|nr:stage III sporulation AC/AD family protein [Clostridia bacterium]